MSDLVTFSPATLEEGKVKLGNKVKGTIKKSGESFKGQVAEIRRIGNESPKVIVVAKHGMIFAQFENISHKAKQKTPASSNGSTGNPFIDRAKNA